MADTPVRSPWPWIAVGLGILALIIAVALFTRPAYLADREGDKTTIIEREPAAGRQPPAVVERRTEVRETEDEGSGRSGSGPMGGQPAANAPAEGGTGAMQEQAAAQVAVDMGEWFVRVTPAEVPAGPTAFRVRNVGDAPHGFEIEGQGTEAKGNRIESGAEATTTTTLAPGDYTIYCWVGNHRGRGMETQFRVTESR